MPASETDRHATVGAALCGRPSLPRRGAPTDLPIATGAGIFPDASVKSSCPQCLRGEAGVLLLQGHCLAQEERMFFRNPYQARILVMGPWPCSTRRTGRL